MAGAQGYYANIGLLWGPLILKEHAAGTRSGLARVLVSCKASSPPQRLSVRPVLRHRLGTSV
eukprot:scaffold276625_cov18-Tisochrysis_lutea.AAC.3